jgi:hypothetical protein
MKVSEIKEVIRDFIDDKIDRTITLVQLYDATNGCAFWGKEKRMLRKEMLVRLVNYQCRCFDGSVDEEALNECCEIMKKSVIMV